MWGCELRPYHNIYPSLLLAGGFFSALISRRIFLYNLETKELICERVFYSVVDALTYVTAHLGRFSPGHVAIIFKQIISYVLPPQRLRHNG